MANWAAGANVLRCYAISQSNFTDAQLTLLQPGGGELLQHPVGFFL